MTKEQKRKEAVKEAVRLFDGMDQETANKYFTDNFMITQITKAHMAAYIKKFTDKAADAEWLETFKKASYKEVPKQYATVCLDKDNNPIMVLSKKTGKGKPKVKRVDSSTGEMITQFNLNGARKEFLKHFNIKPKANKFTPKEKRTEKVYDEFADIFG